MLLIYGMYFVAVVIVALVLSSIHFNLIQLLLLLLLKDLMAIKMVLSVENNQIETIIIQDMTIGKTPPRATQSRTKSNVSSLILPATNQPKSS